MTKDELLEMGYGWLLEGIGELPAGDDVEPWVRVQFADAATRLEGRPGPIERWRSAMRTKVELIGSLAALAAKAAAQATGAEPRVTAADCELVIQHLGQRGLLTSLCDPDPPG